MNEDKNLKNNNYPSLEEMKAAELRYWETRKKPGSKITELPAEYAAKLKTKKDFEKIENTINMVSLNVKEKKTAQKISYEKAAKQISNGYKNLLDQRGEKFIAEYGENQNMKVVRKVIKYFIGESVPGWSHKKGLLLGGPTGTGKTTLFELMRAFCIVNKLHDKFFNCVAMPRLEYEIEKAKDISFLDKYLKSSYCFHDVSAENTDRKIIYGNHGKILERITLIAELENRKTGRIYHMDSNLPISELGAIHGDVVESRLKGLFNEVMLTGIDKRTVKPA